MKLNNKGIENEIDEKQKNYNNKGKFDKNKNKEDMESNKICIIRGYMIRRKLVFILKYQQLR